VIRALRRDEDGATVVEFALIAPVALMLLLGMFDMGYNLYTASVLQGSIQQAARNSAIEGAEPDQLDASVASAVRNVTPNAEIAFARKSYANFSDVRTPEDFSDLNGDTICNDGEPFEDVNGNTFWDSDRGTAGGGGARDAVLYSVTVEYPRAFPVTGLLGLSEDYSLTVETVLRNQPWNAQSGGVTTGNCA
jgi:Flp pilus assembly pilin Flp